VAIYAPGKRINPSIKRRTGVRKTVYASLFLTSMVDMFAILVIFLLQSFSSEGEIIILPSGIQLPKAVNTGTLSRAPSVVVGLEEILFEGQVVAQTQEFIGREAWEIPPLQTAVRVFRENREAQAIVNREISEEDQQRLQEINVSADRRLNFEIVRKVLYSVAAEGFPAYQFAVYPGRRPEVTD